MKDKIKEFFKNFRLGSLPEGSHLQWISLNRILAFYRYMSAFLLLIVLGTWVMMAFFLLRDPIVVVLSGQNRVWVEGKKKDVPVQKEEIVEMIKRFIENRYQWKKLNLSEMTQNIQPITTPGLFEKIREDLINFVKKDMAKKTFQQAVTNIEVKITDKAITANFDRVIRVDDIPLIAPLQLSLELIRGARTNLNPIGLYINGIIEHQRN